MRDLSNILSYLNILNKSIDEEKSKTDATNDSESDSKNKNGTDPIVCHDPSLSLEGIATILLNQNQLFPNDDNAPKRTDVDLLKTDGIEYPLVVINNRNIDKGDILYMNIDYTRFLPSITLKIRDVHENEQKISSTQMSSIIRVCIISNIDNVYKKILLNFRTYDVQINPHNTSLITYFGTYYVEGFRQINTKHIFMDSICDKSENCNQGGHINANTWEMLHKIAELTGLGFAATKNCKEIEDRVIRNIYSQRYDQFIEHQLLHSGVDENSIFDAWVDLYGYIVMVNFAWIMNEDIDTNELNITANFGFNNTSNETPEQVPKTVHRILTNFNKMKTPSNLEISSYNTEINNSALKVGTLETVYSINFTSNLTSFDTIDIQSKQNSIDGDFIEDYNTGKSNPIPKFNFNDDAWTGLSGGYNLHQQTAIRNAYFRKYRQNIFNVELKRINLGLQRGTLVGIAIFDDDARNKELFINELENIIKENDNINPNEIEINGINIKDLVLDPGEQFINIKLSGIYYIDGMTFKYDIGEQRIIQILHLIKKGMTSGYENRHTMSKMPKNDEQSPENNQSSNIEPRIIPVNEILN